MGNELTGNMKLVIVLQKFPKKINDYLITYFTYQALGIALPQIIAVLEALSCGKETALHSSPKLSHYLKLGFLQQYRGKIITGTVSS